MRSTERLQFWHEKRVGFVEPGPPSKPTRIRWLVGGTDGLIEATSNSWPLAEANANAISVANFFMGPQLLTPRNDQTFRCDAFHLAGQQVGERAFLLPLPGRVALS